LEGKTWEARREILCRLTAKFTRRIARGTFLGKGREFINDL